MSVSTLSPKSSRAARISGIDAASVELAKQSDALDTAAPTSDSTAPNLQATLDTAAPTLEVEPSAVEVITERVDYAIRLTACILRQSAQMVAWYGERGAIVIDSIDQRNLRATSSKSRDTGRGLELTGLTATATLACDAISEPKPNLNRWVEVAALIRMFPNAVYLPSVRVASEFVKTMDRVMTPKTWDAPETYSVRPRYDVASLSLLIDRAVSERMSSADVEDSIAKLGGKIGPDAVVEKTTNPIDAARALAKKTVESMIDGDIDPFAYFLEFVELSGQYGYSVAPTHTANGSPSYKLLKIGK
jgi:hypothetical protein